MASTWDVDGIWTYATSSPDLPAGGYGIMTTAAYVQAQPQRHAAAPPQAEAAHDWDTPIGRALALGGLKPPEQAAK